MQSVGSRLPQKIYKNVDKSTTEQGEKSLIYLSIFVDKSTKCEYGEKYGSKNNNRLSLGYRG